MLIALAFARVTNPFPSSENIAYEAEMGDVVSTLKANWTVIAQAPWAFVAWTIFIAGVVWVVVNHLKENRIEALEGRLKLRDDEITDYKRKLSGATPDEAKARIDSLEGRLNQLSPRRVTAEQREQIRTALVSIPGNAVIGSDMACADAPAFAAGLIAAFQAAGWGVSNPSFMGLSGPPMSGLGLRVADPANLSPKEAAIASTLRGVGLSVDVQPGKSVHQMHDQMPLADIELVITPRVLD